MKEGWSGNGGVALLKTEQAYSRMDTWDGVICPKVQYGWMALLWNKGAFCIRGAAHELKPSPVCSTSFITSAFPFRSVTLAKFCFVWSLLEFHNLTWIHTTLSPLVYNTTMTPIGQGWLGCFYWYIITFSCLSEIGKFTEWARCDWNQRYSWHIWKPYFFCIY